MTRYSSRPWQRESGTKLWDFSLHSVGPPFLVSLLALKYPDFCPQFSFLSCLYSLGEFYLMHAFKKHLYADDSQVFISSSHFSLESLLHLFSCLLDISTCYAFLVTPIIKFVLPRIFSTSVDGNSTPMCAWAKNLGIVLDFSFSPTSHTVHQEF